MKWVKYSILTFLVLITWQVFAQDQPFTVSVSSTKVGVDQSFRITFNLEGSGSDFQPPNFKFFDVLWGPKTSTQVQIINGNYSRTQSYIYKIKPQQKGNFEIGSATIQYNGKSLKTKPITIKVVEETQQSSKQDALVQKIRDRLYIKCMVDNRNPYQGEQITATYKLYIGRLNIGGYEVEELPQFNGFWKETIKEPKRLNAKTEVINGQRFKTAVLRKVALFPQRNGELTLDPFKMKFKIRYRDPSQSRGFFGGGYETKAIYVSSNPVKIDVKPLPPNAPPSFDGLVGSFELNSELNKKHTITDNPVSLEISVSGRGNLSMIQPFDLNLPPVFESYSPKVDESLNKSGNTIAGVKRFEYLLIPRSPGKYKIEPVTFSYFDPQKEKYITHKTRKYVVRVNQSAGGDDSPGVAGRTAPDQNDVEVINKDIRYIRTNPGDLRKDQQAFVFSTSFWGMALSPFLLLAGMIYYRRKVINYSGETLDMRSQKARKLARKKLRTAQKNLKNSNEEGFYEALSEAMWGYAGDKMNISMADMTQDHIKEVFEQKGVEASLINQFIEVIDNCEQARFAPSLGNFDMKELYQNAEEVISNIERQLQ